MRRFLLALSVVTLAFAPAHAADFNAADKADLQRISDYLNSIHTMRGGFLQVGPDGRESTGKFYILKPGKMRFDYDPPTPTLVIANGLSVVVFNTRLKTSNSYPESASPLNLLLSDNIHLARSSSIERIEHQAGELIVNARSSDQRTSSKVSIVFTDPNLELRQWTIIDAQGLATTVSLRDVQTGVDLPESAFKTTQ
jgi:outer membrane lipoprotein-sorting protein